MIVDDNLCMRLAIKEGLKACREDEVPIGAIIVKDNVIIAKAHNKRNSSKIATHHAEILAIEKACKKIGDWRLEGATIYVTLEPCPMCAGAIANSRIKKLVFGAYDTSAQNKTILNTILNDTRLNHKVEILGGVLDETCSEMLTGFFQKKRNK